MAWHLILTTLIVSLQQNCCDKPPAASEQSTYEYLSTMSISQLDFAQLVETKKLKVEWTLNVGQKHDKHEKQLCCHIQAVYYKMLY